MSSYSRLNIFYFFLFTVFFFLLTEPTPAINKKRVALFQINAVNTSEVYAQKMFSELQGALTISKKLSLASEKKEELLKKIEEMKKAGCTEAECLTNAGIELDVEKILAGELRQMPEGYFELDMRMVDVLLGEYEFAYETIKGEGVNDFNKMARSAVDMIDSKILIEPSVQYMVGDSSVIIDAGADLGIKKGMRFNVIRILSVQKDGRGKIIFRKEEKVGEIEIIVVQALGSSAKITSQVIPFEVGDLATALTSTEKIDEPPKIIHSPVVASVQGKEILIQANIVGDNKIEAASLLFRNKTDGQYGSIPLVNTEKDKYSAIIPATSIKNDKIEYYLTAVDSKGLMTEKKDDFKKPFSVMILVDKEPPSLEHSPVLEANSDEQIVIRAQAKDNVKVSRVVVYYKRKEENTYKSLDLVWQGSNAYAVFLPEIVTIDAKLIDYYLVAIDQAGNSKMVGSLSQPFKINMLARDTQGPQITHSPLRTYSIDNLLMIDAQISDTSGVAEAAVFFKTEYEFKYQKFPLMQIIKNHYQAVITKDLKNINNAKLQYYIWAADIYKNEQTFGSNDAPIVVLPKTSAPSIALKESDDSRPPFVFHIPPINMSKKGLGYPMIVFVDDESDIGSVIAYIRGTGEQQYRQLQLRKLGGGWYGDFISKEIQPLTYYIVCKDVFDNTTLIGDESDPIIIRPDEIISGNYKYAIGHQSIIDPLEVQFLTPKELRDLGPLKGTDIDMEKIILSSAEENLHFEGIVWGSRECESAFINTVRADFFPPGPEELKLVPSAKWIQKFVCDVPTPANGAELVIMATDIGGVCSYKKFGITNPLKTAPLSIVEHTIYKGSMKISILEPSIREQGDTVKVVGSQASLKIVGRIVSQSGIRGVLVNAQNAIIAIDDKTTVKFERLIPLNNGINFVHVKAIGNNGETQDLKFKINLIKSAAKIVDKIPPSIEILIPHNNQMLNNEKLFVRARVTDNQKIDEIKIQVGNTEKPNVKYTRENDGTVLIEDTVIVAEGKNLIQITASSGRQSATKSVEVNYKKNIELPRIFVISPSGESVNETSIALNFNVMNFRTGMKVSVKLNGDVVQPDLAVGKTTPIEINKPVEFICPVKIKQGVNKITISVSNDEVNNSLEKSVSCVLP